MRALRVAVLLMVIGLSAAKAVPPEEPVANGWRSVVPDEPLETNADKLCATIDPPQAKIRGRADVATCRKAAEEQAMFLMSNRAKQAPNAPAICFQEIVSAPYVYADVLPVTPCSAYDTNISHSEVILRSSQDDVWVRKKIGSELAALRAAKSACTAKVGQALAHGRKIRATAAMRVDLREILLVAPKDRVPQEVVRVDAERAACRAEAQRRRDERIKALPSRPVEHLVAIAAKYRIPEEQAAIDAAIAAHRAMMAKRRADKKWMGPVFSAEICVATTERRTASVEIKTEYKYARHGGMVDKVKIYDLQQKIREQDEIIAGVRRDARAIRASVQGCSQKLIRQIVECIKPGGNVADHCDSDTMRMYFDLAMATEAGE